MKYKYEGWIGSAVDHYFNNLDAGKWKEISRIKYWFLNSRGFTVRKTKI